MFVIRFERKFGKHKETIHEHYLSVHLRQLAKRVEVPLKQYTIFKISICMYFKKYILSDSLSFQENNEHAFVYSRCCSSTTPTARNLLVFGLHLKTQNISAKTWYHLCFG